MKILKISFTSFTRGKIFIYWSVCECLHNKLSIYLAGNFSEYLSITERDDFGINGLFSLCYPNISKSCRGNPPISDSLGRDCWGGHEG